ncbi:hypothetical protein CYMTET_39729 [Cymbomonas tetramitiformis]|uniref:Uncharacterized protein n=1 Tax=Cymbomonas tetramitiformis TaxID=36881 RepID=A0AAE0C9J0_9CHLO|nr:hypothetical protein CYMTET_39729 [Cymbomonas tetramitiformis]
MGRTETIHATQWPDGDSEEPYARGREDAGSRGMVDLNEIISDAVVAKLQQSQSENAVSSGSVQPLKETAHSEEQLEEKPMVDVTAARSEKQPEKEPVMMKMLR